MAPPDFLVCCFGESMAQRVCSEGLRADSRRPSRTALERSSLGGIRLKCSGEISPSFGDDCYSLLHYLSLSLTGMVGWFSPQNHASLSLDSTPFRLPGGLDGLGLWRRSRSARSPPHFLPGYSGTISCKVQEEASLLLLPPMRFVMQSRDFPT